ncbi:MAG: glutamate--tRNA ligase [Alphaproteobacteria bacterium]
MNPKTTCRFAPSPSGFLHGGNVRIALLNYLYARKYGGKFILRFDDTDSDRSKPEYEIAIKQDLTWLGFSFDAIYKQSERLAFYHKAVETLKKNGRVYACYETPAELALMRKTQEANGKPPLYNRAALKLTREKIFAYEQAGQKPYYRFLLEDKDMTWQDMVKDRVHFVKNIISDPVVVRGDGIPLYSLSSVVDDGLLGITLILRGDDHLTNSAAQIQLFTALGYAVPAMAHVPRMVDGTGSKLSKRLGAKSIKDYRLDGIHPRALLAYFAHLGLALSPSGYETMDDLIKMMELDKFGKAEQKFFEKDLLVLNKKILTQLDFADAKLFYGKAMSDINEVQWQKIHSSIAGGEDMADWQKILQDDFVPSASLTADEKKLLAMVLANMPNDFHHQAIENFLDNIKKASGHFGKAFFSPLRLSLTGRLDGPSIVDIFLLLGREKILSRLSAITSVM